MNDAGEPLLWIVDPSLHCAEDEGTGEIAAAWGGAYRVFQPVLRPEDGPGPDHGHDCSAIAIMGSAASVHDDAPWLGELRAWLRPVIAGTIRRPLLGICFGHQLVAHMAGASVGWLDPVDRRKRVGVEPTCVSVAGAGAARESLRVVVSHREIVEELPSGFDVLGERPGVEFDAIAHRELPIVACQFHPEARREFAERAGIEPTQIDQPLIRDSRRVLDGFFELVRRESVSRR